jgi:hypothetical protein
MVGYGAVVVEVLETKVGAAPTKADLDAWITSHKLPVTSMIDAPSSPLATYHALGRREQGWVVQLPSMTIVKKYTGSTDGSPDGLISTAVADLKTLLGK